MEKEVRKPKWNPKDQELVDWLFQATNLPTEPFKLDICTMVSEPQKFYSKLKRDALEGPRGIRARNGFLQELIYKLRKVCDAQQ